MHPLPLYPSPPESAIEVATPSVVDSGCRRCGLHDGVRTVCMRADGEPGGLLVVGEAPGRDEDSAGRPFVGQAGRLLRQLVARHWSGPVAFDNAIRCTPPGTRGLGAKRFKTSEITACRGYLAQTLAEVRPKRILALGPWAAVSLLGRSVQSLSARRGYGWLYDPAVPVFYAMPPTMALHNRFLHDWFAQDVRWALTAPVPQDPWGVRYHVVRTIDDARRAAGALRGAAEGGPWIAYDCETAGRMFCAEFRLLAVALASADGAAYVWGREALADGACSAALRAVMSNDQIKKIGQNVKFDMLAIRCGLGVEALGVVGDTRLWRRLMQSDAVAKLETMSELVGMGGHKAEMFTAKSAGLRMVRANLDKLLAGELFSVEQLYPGLDPAIDRALRRDPKLLEDSEKYAYAFVPDDIRNRYVARDAVTTARLGVLLRSWLEARPDLLRIWSMVVGRATRAVEQIEAWGVRVDRDAIAQLRQFFGGRVSEVRARIVAYGDYNPNKPADMARLLYGQLGLPCQKATAGGAQSTDEEALEVLDHDAVRDLLEYRRLTKLKGTYADGLASHIRDDGRIHTDLKIDGTGTGRLSSADPNLQNIPRDTDPEGRTDGRRIRSCFVASPGHVLLEADYNQLELRVAAMLSQDPAMIEIYRAGLDFHLRTAQLIAPTAWKIRPEDVKDNHRADAKRCNFGLIYGLGDRALAAQIRCSVAVAARVREAVLGQFKKLKAWMEARKAETRKTGHTWTWWHGERARSRPLFGIADHDDARRNTAENAAANTPIQGTGSEFCLASVIEIVDWISREHVPAKLVLTVHDSILLEVPESLACDVATRAQDIMTSWTTTGPGMPLEVPLVVDFKVGRTWGSMEKYKFTRSLPVQVAQEG